VIGKILIAKISQPLGGVTKTKPNVRLSKNDSKKSKSAKRVFMAQFLTFWLNLIKLYQWLKS
jgi:hypothetical protein